MTQSIPPKTKLTLVDLSKTFSAKSGTFLSHNDQKEVFDWEKLIAVKISSLETFDEFVDKLFLALLFCEENIPLTIYQKLNQKLSEYVPKIRREKIDLAKQALRDIYARRPIHFELYLISPGFLLLDSEAKSPEGTTFCLDYHIEMMSLLYALGLKTDSRFLINHGIKMALATLHLLDRNSKLPIGPFIHSSGVAHEQMRALHAIVLTSIYVMSQEKSLNEVVAQLEPFCSSHQSYLSPLAKGIIELIINATKIESFPKLLFSQQHSLGFANLSDLDSSLIVDFFGQGTPLGFYETKACEFRAFGLQYGPLGDMSTFGTFRMENPKNGFSQLIEGEEVAKFKGWTRLHDEKSTLATPIPGSVFAQCQFEKSKKGCQIKVKLEGYTLKHKLYFTFFVVADRVELDNGISLSPRTLEKYYGLTAPVSFFVDNQEVRLETTMKGEMEVIPLEGASHFWGAHFMVSYELTEVDGEYLWTIL